MSLEENLKNIKKFLINRYKNNLAAILIFGSANTKHFTEGKSDIDHVILLKKQNNLDSEKESKFLFKKLKSENFATQYLFTLQGILNHIYKNNRIGWSTYITLASDDGSKILYSTPEFEDFKEKLRKNLPTKEKINRYLKEKDEFELEGYFKEIKGYNLTKSIMAHLRRKLQIMNYFKTGKLIFDYEKCQKSINLIQGERKKLKDLYGTYERKEKLPKKEIDYYRELATRFTGRIIKDQPK